MTASLLFEVWRGARFNNLEMGQVSAHGDELRLKIDPGAVRVHSFVARSDFEAFQLYYDWNGWGRWQPEPDWVERQFTEEEARVQADYLTRRVIG